MNDLIDSVLRLRTWAVVGASNNALKYGHKIYYFLKERGYTVYPVNPTEQAIGGDKCYPKLRELPRKPDVVDVVVPPKVAEGIVKECAALGIKYVWLQPGAESDVAIAAGEQKGITVIHHHCVMAELRQQGGGSASG